MKPSKNTVVLALMLSSVGLLIVLQAFWLQKVYDGAYSNLRRESNFLFRSTIRTMMDSMVQRNIRPVDDTMKIHSKFLSQFAYSSRSAEDDSSHEQVSISDARVQVFVREGTSDSSISLALRPLVKTFKGRRESRNFIIRMESDSLKLDDVQRNYEAALRDANILIPVQVQKVEPHEHEFWRQEGRPIERDSAGLTTESVPVGPAVAFVGVFSDYQSVLLSGILPQILFSIFLTLLTAGSFIVMYKNIRTQQRLMEIKNDFISNISHELKTPVATVSVAIEALRNFDALKDPNTTKEYLDIAQNELSRLSMMTDKILKTSIFEQNGVTFVPEPVDLSGIIEDVLASLRLLLDQKGARVTVERLGTSFVSNGSHVHLTNVIYNLLDNAIKYSDNNPAITVKLEETDNNVIVSVSDNGVGIPEEYRDKIFEKFFRVPSGDIHNTKGYGLGLSYVKSVIKAHLGKIDVKSSDAGTTFVVTLPL